MQLGHTGGCGGQDGGGAVAARGEATRPHVELMDEFPTLQEAPEPDHMTVLYRC